MFANDISIRKNDVRVSTNGDCVDVRVAPSNEKGNTARVVTVTLERTTAVRLSEALEAYLKLDQTM